MDLLLWQLADSGFPAGGFAHSGGLEAAMQLGEVTDAERFWRFVCEVVRQAGRSALPLVTAAHAEPGAFRELDALCDAYLSNPVANRASRAQGRALLTACVRSFPQRSQQALQEAIGRELVYGHHAPVFGVTLKALGISRQRAQRLFLFVTSRGVMSAAVRLGLIGVFDAQRLQMAVGPEIDRTIDRCAGLDPLAIAQTAPLVDLFQSTHDRLYSRLFQS